MDPHALADLLDLTGQADSVELKVTIPSEGQRDAVAALGLDPLGAQVRLVHFFDTPDLALLDAGVVVRARRIQGKGEDTVVKLRPVVPSDLPGELRAADGFVTEVDVMPGSFVCSGLGVPRKATIPEVTGGDRPLRRLLSREQRRFYAEHAPAGVALDDLVLLGPVFILKIKGTPPGTTQRMVVELWLYPDGTRILELSTKCAPGDTLQVAGELRAMLARRGVAPGDDQQTKTRSALAAFAARLAPA